MNESSDSNDVPVFEYQGIPQEASEAVAQALEELGFTVNSKGIRRIVFSGDFHEVFPRGGPWQRPIASRKDYEEYISGQSNDASGCLCIEINPFLSSLGNPVSALSIAIQHQIGSTTFLTGHWPGLERIAKIIFDHLAQKCRAKDKARKKRWFWPF